jgi:hypothetical protein
MLLVVLVCFFPYWFTREGDPDLCFKGTGEIGDTIGGIMGPFVAIIAAFPDIYCLPHPGTMQMNFRRKNLNAKRRYDSARSLR